MSLDYTTTLRETRTSDERRAEIFESPGFGRYFSDHMVQVTWTAEGGWANARVIPYGPIALDPASAVLHLAVAAR